MARVALEEFDGKEVSRIYLAARLAEAKSVETALTNTGIEYAVEVEPYLATAVFWVSEYRGAAFYVLFGQADFCRRVLREAGLTAGLLEEELS